MSASNHVDDELDDNLLDAEEVGEVVVNGVDQNGHDEDHEMDSDDEEEELELQNDSVAYFDLPQDSLFTVAQHPVWGSLVAVGGSAGQEDEAPGAGWIFDISSAPSRPVLPPSYASGAVTDTQTSRLESLFSLEGHTDSITSLTWTLPQGEVLISAGLDGRVKAWKTDVQPPIGIKVTPLGEAQEVDEVNWVAACPSPSHPNTIALGAKDGSVWVYTIDPSDPSNALQIVQSYFLHGGPCTAGAWTHDGQLLATVSEDGSLYVWDVWGAAAAQGLTNDNGMTVVTLTAEDQRFEVLGGLYSIAIDPRDTFLAVGGGDGSIKVVSLPRLGDAAPARTNGRGGRNARSGADPTAGGQILASLQNHTDSVETLSISVASTSPLTVLLAAGSVDGGITVFDATRSFSIRKHLVAVHNDFPVVKVEFIPNTWVLTSCGMDGVVRRWDVRASGTTDTSSSGISGLLREWKGHRGDGDGGGVMDFVQGGTGQRVVTAGDDGISLVFESE